MTRGVVAGKFHPFHLGHKYLIDTALGQVDRLDIVVCTATGETIPGEVRAEWIAETYRTDPRIRLHVFDWTGLDPDDSQLWAQLTIQVIGARPDVCFTSEPYGDAWASFLGCEHRSVDPDRRHVPTSGTEIRRDVLAHFDDLPAATRAFFCRRVCVLGAESSGKTTLAADLACTLATDWVPEYGRTYCEQMDDPSSYVWSTADFQRIIEHQHADEDSRAATANRVLICDTDAFTTCVFHQTYLEIPAPETLAAQVRDYHLYVLTDVTTPFEQDGTGLRKREAREAMDSAYREMLTMGNRPVVAVTGTPADRTQQAVAAIDRLLERPIVLSG